MQAPLTQARTKILSLAIKDTGTYNPLFRRGYQTSFDPATVATIVERVATTDRFSPMLMSGIAGQFLQPAATPENPNPIAIPHGWEQKRGRFVLQLMHEFPALGTHVIEQVSGFTDYDGFTTSGSVDPQMQFYVNSCVQLRQSPVVQTPMGLQSSMLVTDNSHVLADAGFSNIYTPVKEQRMRPEDVYSHMSRLGAVTTGSTTDMRTTLTQVALKSRRSNALPSEYMAGILENHRVAAVQQELGSGEQDILASARGKAAEPSAPRDPFLAAIGQVRGTPPTKVFTYGDLQVLDPNVDRVAIVGFSPPAEAARMHQAHSGETADWNGSDQTTVIATMLSQGVVALMMELGIAEVGFIATNQTMGGMFDYREYALVGFNNQVSMAPYSQMFRDAFQSKLWSDITTVPGGGFGAQFGLNVDVHARAMGETRVIVQFENNAPVKYAIPTYCDSLVVPVLTTNVQQAENLAKDFRELISVVQQETSNFSAVDANGQDLFQGT